MSKFAFFALFLLIAAGARASWYWPFGSDESDDSKAPRLSVLLEPASLLIDEASDLAADGKVSEAVEKYRGALTELDRIEMENPERAKSTEFASLRNKRAYVNAAIDSMLLSQVKSNAKVVAVSDTTELEKRLAEEKAQADAAAVKAAEVAKADAERQKKASAEKINTTDGAVVEKGVDGSEVRAKSVAKSVESAANGEKPKASGVQIPLGQRVMADIANGDYAAADAAISKMLVEKPNGATALNLKAMSEVRQGRLKEAERTLDRAIMSNPRSYYAYYNMADIILKVNPGSKAAAKRYYETGRVVGGPVDEKLEQRLK